MDPKYPFTLNKYMAITARRDGILRIETFKSRKFYNFQILQSSNLLITPIFQFLYLCKHEKVQPDISHPPFDFAAARLNGGFSGES